MSCKSRKLPGGAPELLANAGKGGKCKEGGGLLCACRKFYFIFLGGIPLPCCMWFCFMGLGFASPFAAGKDGERERQEQKAGVKQI